MNNSNRGGLAALLVLGGYLVYRNRATIQRELEARGIKTPLDTSGKLREAIRSGIARLKGSQGQGPEEPASGETKELIYKTG